MPLRERAACFLAIALSFSLAVPALAQEASTAPGEETELVEPIVVTKVFDPKEDKERVVCEQWAPAVGTRLKRKETCRTKRQKKADEALNRELVRDTFLLALRRNTPG